MFAVFASVYVAGELEARRVVSWIVAEQRFAETRRSAAKFLMSQISGVSLVSGGSSLSVSLSLGLGK